MVILFHVRFETRPGGVPSPGMNPALHFERKAAFRPRKVEGEPSAFPKPVLRNGDGQPLLMQEGVEYPRSVVVKGLDAFRLGLAPGLDGFGCWGLWGGGFFMRAITPSRMALIRHSCPLRLAVNMNGPNAPFPALKAVAQAMWPCAEAR